MKRAAFAVPGDLDTPTGGYAYDKRIIAELRELGWQIEVIDLGGSFPYPDQAARAAAMAKLLGTEEDKPIVIDGLAFGVMAAEAKQLRARNPLVALVHHPLALETGIDAARAQALRDSERAALACVRSAIVTSRPTAAVLAGEYAVPSDRIAVIRPGVDRMPARMPQAERGHAAVRLLAVGSVAPRKGYDLLIEALAGLETLPWLLVIAGDTTRHPAAFERLESDIERFHLPERVVVEGAVTAARLAELYANADVFVLASRFEGYGMVLGEAVAHGLPVVATTVGAALDIVPANAGILVAPGEANAMRNALRQVIANADLRGRMASAARDAAAHLPEWRQSAIQFAQVLEALR